MSNKKNPGWLREIQEKTFKKSNRERTKLWRKKNSTLFYCFTPSFDPVDFDKYVNYELEKKFYEDQINQRVMFFPKEIYEEY